MPDASWFKDGLRFKCTQCGNCCTGEPGYVWVNDDEIAAMAKTLGMTLSEFEQTYVRQVGIRKSLIERANGDCIFLDGKTRECKVYAARPRQCRTWPFWDSNVRTPEEWKETCLKCPGSGHGKLYTAEEIIAQSAVIRV